MDSDPAPRRWWPPARRGVFVPALVSLGLLLALSACGASGGGGSAPAPAATLAPFTVTGVDLSVRPASIAGVTCGSAATFTYTAIFHIPAQTPGGVIKFSYTLNNGRSQTLGAVTVGAGETSKTFTFTSSGTLLADHTYPGPALVMVTSPNTLISPAARPTGSCVEPGAFKVTAISLAVSPTSVAGKSCGTHLTVTYTATFHLAPNAPGGTITFEYTINNGRGSNAASMTVAPGQTTATYAFTWSGDLPADHTYPEPGGVITSSPNVVASPLIGPSGTCG